MAVRLALLGLAVSLAITYGAVIPREDDVLFDTIQSFLAAPDTYASALGFSRAKRSSGDWDKEFNLNSVGASVKIKYDDPNNQLKGGRAQITVDDLKKYIKRAKSSKVQLDIKFDGGASPKDGLFSMEVNYELHHDGVEKGVLTVVRSMSGGLWNTHIENKNLQKPNGTPIFQAFEIKGKSDRKTMATGTYNSARFGTDYVFNVDRVPGEKMDATLEGNGKKYVMNAVVDKEDKKLTVNLNSNGFEYKLEVDADYSGDEIELDVTLNLGSTGKYSIFFSGNKDMTNAKLAVVFNNNPFFKVTIKGKKDLQKMNFKYQAQFDIESENSVLYQMFCDKGFGCFKQRSLKARMYFKKDKPYKIDFDLNLFKDSEEVVLVDISTLASPYVFKIKAPRILPNILPTGRKSIEFEADHNPGQYLHVKSNTNMLSSFNVDKLPNGMRKIELNGKELLQADFNKGDNMVSQTTTLPNGKSLTTTIKWDSDNMKQNKVNLKLDGTERNLDADFEWDVTNTAAMTMKAHGKGHNNRWGDYEVSRDIKMSSMNGVFKMDVEGNSNMEKFFMPSPIKTVLKVMLDMNNNDYMLDVSKDFDGKKMGVVLNNGRISLTL